MKRNFLLSALLSTVLLSTSLFSQNISCEGGHCKVDLKKLSLPKHVAVKVTNFTNTTEIQTNHIEVQDTVLEYETIELKENEEIIVLAPEKYIAGINERLEAMEEEISILTAPIEKIEDTIMNKSLPVSNYYCAKEKKVVYHKDSDSYECA